MQQKSWRLDKTAFNKLDWWKPDSSICTSCLMRHVLPVVTIVPTTHIHNMRIAQAQHTIHYCAFIEVSPFHTDRDNGNEKVCLVSLHSCVVPHSPIDIRSCSFFKVKGIAFLCSVAWPFNLDNWIVDSVDTAKVTLNVLEVVMANRLTATGAFSFSSNRQKKLERQRICSEKQTFIYASKNHSKGIFAGLVYCRVSQSLNHCCSRKISIQGTSSR